MAKVQNKPVQAAIPAALHNLIDEHAWDSRKRLREVVADALCEYAISHGLVTADELDKMLAGDAPAKGTKSE